MDCFGAYFTHVQSCDGTGVQSATQWTASVNTSHMSKAVMEPVFKVLRSGLLRYIYRTSDNEGRQMMEVWHAWVSVGVAWSPTSRAGQAGAEVSKKKH